MLTLTFCLSLVPLINPGCVERQAADTRARDQAVSPAVPSIRQAPQWNAGGTTAAESISMQFFEGLPSSWSRAALEYLAFVASAAGGEPCRTLEQHVLLNNRLDPPPESFGGLQAALRHPPYPGAVVLHPEQPRQLPVYLAPSPELMQQLHNGGCKAHGLTNDDDKSVRIAEAIYYIAGPQSGEPHNPLASPQNAMAFFPPQSTSRLAAGKLIGTRGMTDSFSDIEAGVSAIGLGQPGGAALLGAVRVRALTAQIWCVEASDASGTRTDFLAYPIEDGNGGARAVQPPRTPETRFENTATSPLFSTTFGRHSWLKLPLPMTTEQWTATDRDKVGRVEERIVIPAPLLDAAQGVVLVRKGPQWKPFQGDFILDGDLSAFATDPQSILKVVISSSAPPRRLIELFRHLHCQPSDAPISDADLKAAEALSAPAATVAATGP